VGSWKPDAVERGGLGKQNLGEEDLGMSECAGEPRMDGEAVGLWCLIGLHRAAWTPSQ
jgi:hypothetical protein